MAIDKDLIEILACPQCKSGLLATETEDGLICKTCKIVYPIKEDIPILLVDEAKPHQPSSSNEQQG